MAVYSTEKDIFLNKPVQIGFTILDRSKQIMYDRFYNNILPSLPNCVVSVCLTDTGTGKLYNAYTLY